YDLKGAVASAAIDALVKVARVTPDLSDEIFKTILATCKSDFYIVRDKSINAFVTLGKLIPTQQTIQLLIQACKDDNRYVHQAGYGAIVGLGGLLTTQPEVQAAILKACHDTHPQVRAAAVSALGASVQAGPVRKGAMLEALIYACKEDTDGDVRCIAIQALDSMMPVVPQEMRQTMLSVLVKACNDTDCEACEAAVCAIVTAVKHVPKQAALEALGNACDARYYTARCAACRALGRLTEEFSIEEVFTKLLQASSSYCEDTETVLTVSQELARAVIKDPTSKLLERLLKHYDTADDSSCCAILRSFEYILLGKPAHVDEILTVLEKAFLCRDYDSYTTARYTLMAIGKRTPRHTTRIIEFLTKACKNNSVQVCHRATKTLMELNKTAPSGRTIEELLAAHNNKHGAITGRMLVEGVKTNASQQTLEALLAAYQKYDWKAVDSITKALKALLLAQPSHAPRALEFLLKACKAPSLYVHLAATEALVVILEIVPEHVSKVLRDLLDHYGSAIASAGEQSSPDAETNAEFTIHHVSAKTFNKIVKAAPMGTALQTLLNALQASKSNACLRVTIINTLGVLAKADPIYAEKSMAHILGVVSNDARANVRRAAIDTIEGLIDMASTCSNKTLQKLQLALEKVCKDSDVSVRDAAEALLEEVKGTAAAVDLDPLKQ
ncbi:MAG: HEAT repeat domain-containing protein, partial [Bacteroidota bacterium]